MSSASTPKKTRLNSLGMSCPKTLSGSFIIISPLLTFGISAYIAPKKVSLADPKNANQRKAFEKSISDWVKARVANHKQLRGGVFVIAAVPKSATGKILRKDLRELAKKDEGSQQQQQAAKL